MIKNPYSKQCAEAEAWTRGVRDGLVIAYRLAYASNDILDGIQVEWDRVDAALCSLEQNQ